MPMILRPASYCKRCRFYHGANWIVCALHPYGPDSKHCADYASKPNLLSQFTKSQWNIRQFSTWKSWQKLLLLVLLWGSIGFSLRLGWVATHPPEPSTNRPSNSGHRIGF